MIKILNVINIIMNWNKDLSWFTDFKIIKIFITYIAVNLELMLIIYTLAFIIRLSVLSWYVNKKYRYLNNTKKFCRIYKKVFIIRNITNFTKSCRLSEVLKINLKKSEDLYDNIIKATQTNILFEIFMSIFEVSIIHIISIMITLIYYYSYKLNNIKIANFIRLDLVIDYIKTLPSFILLLILLLSFYYVSFKGKLKRALNKLNSELLKDSLDIHRKIVKNLRELIYISGGNINYAIINKNLIISSHIKSISPFIDFVEGDNVKWYDSKHEAFKSNNIKFNFKNISQIKYIVDIFKSDTFKDLSTTFWIIGAYSYKITGIYNFYDIGNFKNLSNKLNRYFFTEEGFNKFIKNPCRYNISEKIKTELPEEEFLDSINKDIIKEKQDFQYKLEYSIIIGLEMLIELSIYYKSMYDYLNPKSHKLNNIIQFITSRE